MFAIAKFADAAPDWQQWVQRWYDVEVLEKPVEVEGEAVRLPLKGPGDNEFFVPVQGLEAGRVSITLRALVPLPEGLLVYAFVKDWDDQWMQIRHEIPGDGTAEFTLHLPLRGPQTVAWRPRNHRRPWHQLTAGQARELGLKFDSDSPVAEIASEIEVLDVAMDDGPALPAGEVRNLWKQPSAPEVGGKIEIGFEVTHPFRNPFDRSDVDLRATIIGPDGATVVVPAFYFEDFLFDHEDDQSTQIPFGNPQFRVRFTPTLPGPHSFVISGSVGSQSVSLPVIKMDVAARDKPWPGFVSRSVRDDRLLAFRETGEEFCPVGVNVRSPFDFRYLESFPHTRWRWQNLSMYKRLFQRYKEAGINSIEVWMSPWWLALEWMPDASGNHGVGYMNPWRAWKMDQLFAWAAEYDIHIVLLLHNHGKFSTWCDTDWDRSPFNVTRGGEFEQPSEFFTSREGKQATKRFLDYVVARWGHSPKLLTWKLFSEIDLTGEHWQWYKEGPARSWHREMGRYLDDIDPYHHLVSTHWSDNFGKVNKDLAGVPELDLLLLDGYYQGTGASKLFNVIVGTGEFARDMHKPCLVTEFGGNPWGDSMGHIWHLHHVGLWAGFMNKLAGIPFFWWFSMLEEKDMYGRYEALSKFVADEDRSGAEPYVDSDREDGLILCELRKRDRMWGWMFDPEFYFSGKLNQNEQVHEDRKLRVVGLEAGEYDVEFWNPRTGEVMATESITARDHASGIISLPAFSRDIAFKVKLQE